MNKEIGKLCELKYMLDNWFAEMDVDNIYYSIDLVEDDDKSEYVLDYNREIEVREKKFLASCGLEVIIFNKLGEKVMKIDYDEFSCIDSVFALLIGMWKARNK